MSQIKPKHKVNNKNLYKEVLIIQAKGRISDEFWFMIEHMTTRIEQKYNNRAVDRHDVIYFAIDYTIRKVYKYDHRRSSNVFAFFTEVIKTALAQGYKELHMNTYGRRYRYEVEIPLFSADPNDYGYL